MKRIYNLDNIPEGSIVYREYKVFDDIDDVLEYEETYFKVTIGKRYGNVYLTSIGIPEFRIMNLPKEFKFYLLSEEEATLFILEH